MHVFARIFAYALAIAFAGCRSHASSNADVMKAEQRAGNVITRDNDDPELLAASARARSTLGDFRAALEKPRPTYRQFSMKVSVHEAAVVEHLWLTEVKSIDHGFQGVIDSAPVTLTSIHFGDRRQVRDEDVDDWTYFDGEERRGGETIRILSRRKREAELRGMEGKCSTKEGAEACYELGVLYANGKGVEELPEIAFRLFVLSCDGGSARGCNSAGWDKLRGRGTQPDAAQAGTFFARACPTGEVEPTACDTRGFALVTGLGATQRDVAQGERLLRRACSKDLTESCLMVELMRLHGLAQSPPDVQFCGVNFSALDRGCAGGDAETCILASGILENGLCSTPMDKPRAKQLSDLAAAGGAEWPAKR